MLLEEIIIYYLLSSLYYVLRGIITIYLDTVHTVGKDLLILIGDPTVLGSVPLLLAALLMMIWRLRLRPPSVSGQRVLAEGAYLLLPSRIEPIRYGKARPADIAQ